MTRRFTIGIDLGRSDQAVDRAAAAVGAGASLARVHFALGPHPFPDAQYLEQARNQVAALRAAGLAVMAVVDGFLTVAPAGLATAANATSSLLAAAWAEELVANTSALATAIGPQVAWWEVLPAPNATPADMPAERWVDLVTRLARALRVAAPHAGIVSGGLRSDEADDGVEYLRAAWQAADVAGIWAAGGPPFDAVGVRLAILPDGGSSEEAVSAAVHDRVQRMWRALTALAGVDQAPWPILVTGVGWDADRTGESAHARNLWTTLDALSTEPVVAGSVWASLQDGPGERGGLYRTSGLGPDDRRPAWQAFSDFVQYLRQIAPSTGWLASAETPPEPAAGAADAAPAVTASAAALTWLATDDDLPEPNVFPPAPILEPPAVAAATVAPAADEPPMPEAGGEWPEAAPPAVEPVVAPHAIDEAEPPTAVAATGEWPEAAPPEVEPVVAPHVIDEAEPPTAVAATGEWPEAAPAEEEPVVAPPVAEEAGGVAVALVAGLAAAAAGDEGDDGIADLELAAPVGAAVMATAAETAEAAPGGEVGPIEVTFRIPTVEELLRAQGLDGERLALALAAVAARHGDLAALQPGEYHVELAPPVVVPPDEAAEPSRPPEYTNQQMISALYRAGGGSWALFERSGLVLAELAARRNAPYTGPELTALGDLSGDEQAAVGQALAALSTGS